MATSAPRAAPTAVASERIRDGRPAQERRSDHVREARRARVLQRALSETRLNQLEVRETGEAVAPPEGEADDELEREQAEQPPPSREDCECSERPDDDLVEARRARVDHVEVAVRIREPLQPSLHFVKYYRLGAGPGGKRVEESLQPQPLARKHVLDVRRAGVANLPAEHSGLLELGEPLDECRRRDPAERVPELREAGAAVV